MPGRKTWGVCTAFLTLHVLALFYAFQETNSPPAFLIWKGALWLWSRIHPVGETQCLPLPFHAKHKEPKLSIAIFQVYDKPLPPTRTSWWGLSAALCAHYANRHGYYYQYLFVSSTNGFVKYGHRQRTLHWARIPLLRHFLLQQSFDWFLYLDIDAMINPTQMRFPLTWILSSTTANTRCIIRGNTSSDPHLIFFSNAPQEPHMPCSGIFMISNKSASSLDVWWHHPVDAYFDQNSEFDQHSLHEAIYYYPPSVFNAVVMDIRGFDFHTASSFFLHFSGNRVSDNASTYHHFYHMVLSRISKALGPNGLRMVLAQPIFQHACSFDADEIPHCLSAILV